MGERDRASGVVVPASVELAVLNSHMCRWRSGQIPASEIRIQLYRTYNKLVKACWCDEDVCCAVHDRHVEPHRDCMLR